MNIYKLGRLYFSKKDDALSYRKKYFAYSKPIETIQVDTELKYINEEYIKAAVEIRLEIDKNIMVIRKINFRVHKLLSEKDDASIISINNVATFTIYSYSNGQVIAYINFTTNYRFRSAKDIKKYYRKSENMEKLREIIFNKINKGAPFEPEVLEI